ncbi:MAG: hypothetical protein EBS99_09620 [Betaproteobacteria bacterium]|nr:hypothetical protein [Betaproteobacteria bacterium]
MARLARMKQGRDFVPPHPVQFRGSRIARGLLALGGWRVRFEGLPTLQGVLIVYPHTSNWDFIVMMLAKWTLGVQLSFWGKHTLFRIPIFGPWLRWLGGVPVDRSRPGGMTGAALTAFADAKAQGRYFWLGLSPEGTRKWTPGLRSGFYRTALQADVPLAVVRLDYGAREVRALDFMRLSGDMQADLARLAQLYEGVSGYRTGQAAPLIFVDKPAGGPGEKPAP